jgi:hypothetical protein
MDVKEAVTVAKQHILDIFREEGVENLGLEEVERDNQQGEWFVTVGFSRPWDMPRNALATLAGGVPRRVYKIVRISENTNHVLSVKDREAHA